MRTYRVEYDNTEDFLIKLESIKTECEELPCSSVNFYITWTDEFQEMVPKVAQCIEQSFPDAIYYGNGAAGNILNGKIVYGISVTCYVFEDAATETELVWVEEGTECGSLQDLWDYCKGVKGLKAVELIPSMGYINALKIDNTKIDISDDVVIFGGASIVSMIFDGDIIAKGHPVTGKGLAAVLYCGEMFNAVATYILGWKSMGRKMKVTKSRGKVISEIDGAPAFSIYEKYLDLQLDDNANLVFPLMVEEDGKEFIRTPQVVLPDKSMQMFANIEEGAMVRIAYGDQNTILDSLYEQCPAIDEFSPQAIKVYSCTARMLFWGDNKVDKETLPLQDIAPVSGFYTGGEILRFGKKVRVLNSTLVIIGLREGDASNQRKFIASKYKKKKKSLISRLTFFAEKIVEEQQKQEQELREAEESNRLIDYFVANYKAAYIVNAKTDRFRALNANEADKAMQGEDASFTKTFQGYAEQVDEADREWVRNAFDLQEITKRLKTKREYAIRFRGMPKVYTLWYEMRFTKLNDDEFILSFGNVDNIVTMELTQKIVMRDSYRIFLADLETDTVKAIKDGYSKYNVTHYTMLFKAFIKKLSDKYKEEWKGLDTVEGTRAFLSEQDKREIIFGSPYRERKLVRCTWYVIERIDGVARTICFSFTDLDEAQADREKLNDQIAWQKAKLEAQQIELEAALKKAEVANNSKTSFLFNMSHDIRTPMNAIKGFTSMAKKYLDDKEKVTDYLNKIDISGQQLLTLINQVLEMSRIEAGKVEFDNKLVNIKEKFDSLVTIIAEQAKINGQEFHHKFIDIVHYNVLADEVKMSQIALNIAGNALKYTGKGGRIDCNLQEVPCEQEGWARYIFTVEDTGIGMSEEYLKVLFEPFTREKSSTVSKIQGTGLGMSIVKDIVSLLNGKIDVKSELGKGSRFDVIIDFEIADESEYDKQNNARKKDAAAFKGKRILLVEDNELNREIAKDVLEEFGLIVEEADDGDVAVSMVQEAVNSKGYGYYDIILMDIQMPKMNGYDATYEIRKILASDDSHLPIIAMTANAFEEDRKNAIKAGMDDHLAKPIEIDKLTETLCNYL